MQFEGINVKMQEMKVHNCSVFRPSAVWVIVALVACLHGMAYADPVGHWAFDDTAIDAVGGAEHFVHQVLVAGLLMVFVQGTNPIVQLQQAFVEPLQQLSGFVEEIT